MFNVKVFHKRKMGIKMILIVTALLIIYLFVHMLIFTNKSRSYISYDKLTVQSSYATNFLELHLLKAHIQSALPIVKVTNEENKTTSWIKNMQGLTTWITGFDIRQPTTIIINQILPLRYHQSHIAALSQEVYAEKEMSENETFIPKDKDMPTQPALTARGEHLKPIEDFNDNNIEKEQKIEIEDRQINADEFNLVPVRKTGQNNNDARIFVNNETDLNLDMEKLLNQKLAMDLSQRGPKVLIMHTHTSEAYTPTPENYYIPTDPDRTEDPKYNVVKVGEELTKHLNAFGVEVIHDKTIHDYPSYNGSYKSALRTIQAQIQKNPSIRFVLDIHRDALTLDHGQKLNVSTEIKGETAAQIMFVVGTDQWGLHHPQWKENFKLALKLQQKSSELYPGFARPILLTKFRYNQHLAPGSLIIEVGANGNTLEEALISTEYFAHIFAEVMTEIR